MLTQMLKPSSRSMSSVKNKTILGLPSFAVAFFVWAHRFGFGVGPGVGGTTLCFDPDTVSLETRSLICAVRAIVQIPLLGWKVKTPHVLLALHHEQQSSALCFVHMFASILLKRLRLFHARYWIGDTITFNFFSPKKSPPAVYPTPFLVCNVQESIFDACVHGTDANKKKYRAIVGCAFWARPMNCNANEIARVAGCRSFFFQLTILIIDWLIDWLID